MDEPFLLVKADENEPTDVRTIIATVTPANASNKRVTWSSSDETVATVDNNGVVTGITGGTATITVTSVADTTKKATVYVVVGDLLVPAGWSIQDVIDDAEAGQVIAVAPAEYKEQLVIDKPLTLLGPNAGIAGDSTDRLGEATITYPEQITDTSDKSLIRAVSSNVTVKGFYFENSDLYVYEAGDIYEELYFEGENIIFENNRVKVLADKLAIRIRGPIPESTQLINVGPYDGAVISNNYIEGLSNTNGTVYVQGIGGVVENNVIIGSINGLQVQPYGNEIGGVVKNNEIAAYVYPIWHNYHHINGITGVRGKWTYESNILTPYEPENRSGYQDVPYRWRAFLVMTAEPNIELVGNTFDGSNAFENGVIKSVWANTIGILWSNVNNQSIFDINNNTMLNVTIGAQDDAGNADLNQILLDNTFPEGSMVVGNKIKVPDWADYADTSWYNDPSATSFTIDTAAKLAGLAELVNGGKDFNGKTINLGADIDLEGIAWIPIGTGSNVFKGNFDGDGKKISNLNINRITSYNGLFGNSSNGKLENVTLENINILIYTPDVTNYAYTGSLAGKAQHVNNVTVTGSINIEVTGGARYVGGIVGHLYNGHMSNCELNSNDGVGLISAKYDVGALAGYVYYGTSITNSTVRNMRINGYLGVGGVSGRIQNEYGAFLLENINIENIILGKLNQGVESSCVGGFLGYPYQSITVTIKDSQLKDVRIESSHIYNGLFYGLYSNTEQYGKVILENVNYSGDCTTQSGEYDYLRKAVGLQKGETVKYYSPIKTAIAAYENAENGDYTIIIKDGTYNEDGIVIKQQVGKSLTIKSESEHGAILVNDSSVDFTGIFHVSGGSNYDTGAVTFEGIRFELPAGDEVNCFGIKLLSGTEDRYASNVTVRNCEFIGSVEKSCAVYSASHSSPKDILIEGCKGDGLTALYNGYGNGITIKNSQLTNARGLLNSQSTESANELVIEGVEATIDYQPSKDMDAIKINGGNLTIKNSNITMNYNGATRSSGLLVIRGGSTITIEDDSILTTSKVGGDYDVYTFYGIEPASQSNTVFNGDREDFTYGGTFE